MHDYSEINQAPPGAVVVFEHYLAYAVSLGEASTVVRVMSWFSPGDSWRVLMEALTPELMARR